MPNTTSAKKALRQSNRKRQHNLFWKNKVRQSIKALKKSIGDTGVDLAIIKKQESMVYKVLDKATKNNVIHSNKANRLKSRLAQQVSAHEANKKDKKTTSKSSKEKA